jgi:hypothetical protein
MHGSLRSVLAKSHVAAIALALLILWAVGSMFWGLEGPVRDLLTYIGTGVLILDIPTAPPPFEVRMTMITSAGLLLTGLGEFGFACLVSAWVYRTGPMTALKAVCDELRSAGWLNG